MFVAIALVLLYLAVLKYVCLNYKRNHQTLFPPPFPRQP